MIRIALLLGVLLVAVGCRSKTAGNAVSIGGPNGCMTWFNAGDNGGLPIPGLDEGRVDYHGVLCAIWSDARSSGAGSRGDANGFVFDMEVMPKIGKPVSVAGFSPDGRAGTITIAGTTYDFAAGRLFLISTINGKPVVKQLDRDLTQLLAAPLDFRTYGKWDAEINGFFRDAHAVHKRNEPQL